MIVIEAIILAIFHFHGLLFSILISFQLTSHPVFHLLLSFQGAVNEKMRMAPMAARLSELIGQPVHTVGDCIGPDVDSAVAKMVFIIFILILSF